LRFHSLTNYPTSVTGEKQVGNIKICCYDRTTNRKENSAVHISATKSDTAYRNCTTA